MDCEKFIIWALSDERTLEERFSVELLIEIPLDWWHHKHKTGHFTPWQKKQERTRQRTLNPAYQPSYNLRDLRRAAEILVERTELDWGPRYGDRPVRDIALLRFFPQLEVVKLSAETDDLAVLAELPRLRTLHLSVAQCEDFRVLGRCAQLRELQLHLPCHWPEVAGIENLQDLESLSLNGNLLVFPPGLVFPKVRGGLLSCSPLHARNVRDLPRFPACEFLSLSGVERLDGIEEMPRLRNLTLAGPVRDFAPLTVLSDLTSINYTAALPLDLRPIAALPSLRHAQFNVSHIYGAETPLRDYSTLAASSSLREVSVTGCNPVEMEVAALNAGFPSWAPEFLADTPRPIPPFRMIIAPNNRRTYHPEPPPGRVPAFPDFALRQCEGRWVAREATAWITQRIGHSEWGSVTATAAGEQRSFFATVECYEDVERLPEIIDAMREMIARLRHPYIAELMIALRVPPPPPTPTQAELMQRFQNEQDRAETEQRQREHQEHLDRLYLYNLKKEQGDKIDPEEFAVPPPEPLPPAPWEEEDDEDEDDGSEFGGGVALKKKPDPPPDMFDDEHPLADNYRLLATVTLDEVWFMTHHRALAIHLMRREPNREIGPE